MSDDASNKPANGIDRRRLLKLGAGMGAGVVMGGALEPRRARRHSSAGGPPLQSGPGWKHTSTRASGNGAMDATSRRIVEYVHAFSAADLTPRLQDAFANTMLDTIASLVSGFESEPARICARLARAQRGDLRSTVLGYGIVTTPELAAYANSSMIRHTDFNDHTSDMIGGSPRGRRGGACVGHRRDDGDRPRLSGLRRAVGRRRQHRRVRCRHLLRAGRGRGRRQTARPERGSARQRAVAGPDDARAAARQPQPARCRCRKAARPRTRRAAPCSRRWRHARA